MAYRAPRSVALAVSDAGSPLSHLRPPPSTPITSLSKLPRVESVCSEGLRDGLHFGGQIAAARGKDGGRLLIDVAFGAVDPPSTPGEGEIHPPPSPMRTDHVLPWWSVTKSVLPALVGVAIDRGAVGSFDDPLCKYLPEFARGDDRRRRERVTIADVLTHTAGLCTAGVGALLGGPMSGPARSSVGGDNEDGQDGRSPEEVWDAIVEETCRSELEWWPSGSECAYSLGGAFHAVAEGTLRALGGGERVESYSSATRRLVFEPLGMADSWIGIPPEVVEEFLSTGRIGATFDMRRGGEARGDGSADIAALRLDDPSMGGRGPANELVRLFAALLRDGAADPPGGDDDRGFNGRCPALLAPATARTISAPRHRSIYDAVQRSALDVGLGAYFDPVFAGRHCSSSTFGHGGSRCAFAYADPWRDLAVAVLFNGRPASREHYNRAERISKALYEDLGLVEGAECEVPRRHTIPGL